MRSKVGERAQITSWSNSNQKQYWELKKDQINKWKEVEMNNPRHIQFICGFFEHGDNSYLRRVLWFMWDLFSVSSTATSESPVFLPSLRGWWSPSSQFQVRSLVREAITILMGISPTTGSEAPSSYMKLIEFQGQGVRSGALRTNDFCLSKKTFGVLSKACLNSVIMSAPWLQPT